ncbi:MAG: hypothetical protein QNJ19_02915 [Woeseiaceae bacterium]|nr:hypothetical protein [Woeseiaceae bacterium]
MKTQHEIIIDAPRDAVWDAFARGADAAVLDDITEQRKPDFLAGTAVIRGGRAVIVGHFADHGESGTKVTVYANRFFKGIAKLTSVVRGDALKNDIDRKLDRLKLAIETARS